MGLGKGTSSGAEGNKAQAMEMWKSHVLVLVGSVASLCGWCPVLFI
jgi:hypothetical protein